MRRTVFVALVVLAVGVSMSWTEEPETQRCKKKWEVRDMIVGGSLAEVFAHYPLARRIDPAKSKKTGLHVFELVPRPGIVDLAITNPLDEFRGLAIADGRKADSTVLYLRVILGSPSHMPFILDTLKSRWGEPTHPEVITWVDQDCDIITQVYPQNLTITVNDSVFSVGSNVTAYMLSMRRYSDASREAARLLQR